MTKNFNVLTHAAILINFENTLKGRGLGSTLRTLVCCVQNEESQTENQSLPEAWGVTSAVHWVWDGLELTVVRVSASPNGTL